MSSTAWIQAALDDLRLQHRHRTDREFPEAGSHLTLADARVINLSSNDYLDLSRHPEVVRAAGEALARYGAGATASRLIAGTTPLHHQLEAELADLKGYPSALLFGSGYMTNAGVIPAVVGRGDHVFADRLAHASLIDAAMLSRARLHRFHHNDPAHLDQLLARAGSGRKLVVTESVFSMDGDLAPLVEIAECVRRNHALLLVDEAHATGVFGPGGAGLVREHGLTEAVDLSMGTLSKALGGYGGFVCCGPEMRALLVNRARAFIYTTAPPPPVVGAALGALAVLRRQPDLGRQVVEKADSLRTRLRQAGLSTVSGESQILPILVGGSDRVVRLADHLLREGVLAVAIRPPTVPAGTERIRLSVTLAHTEEDLEKAAEVLVRCVRQEERS